MVKTRLRIARPFNGKKRLIADYSDTDNVMPLLAARERITDGQGPTRDVVGFQTRYICAIEDGPIMKPTVYIETTIPNYYFDRRTVLTQQAARTRQWWDQERDDYECFLSPAVMVELEAGQYAHQKQCLQLVKDLPVLEHIPWIEEITAVYWSRKLMPSPPSADAIHVAFASYYRMDYLLTWNIRHLANVRKDEHLRVINMKLGLHVPRLITPDQLLPTEDSP
jgi:predicted nucleic acid-binding protein